MSNVMTWAVLCDGRYLRVMINNGEDKKLSVLDADKNAELSELCYQMVNSKPEFSVKGSVKAQQLDFIQLQADFLAKQHEQGLYDRIVLVAPTDVMKSLRNALPDNVNQLIANEIAEDLTAKSCDVIEAKLADLI